MSLAESLERAATACPEDADAIRPANGDAARLFELLDASAKARVLGWLLENEPEAGKDLAEGWLQESDGSETLASLSAEGLPKAGRKILRGLIHRARSQGQAVEEPSNDRAHVGRLPEMDETISVGFLSPYDPRGGRLVYFVESNPAGGAQVFEALIDEERGIVDFQVYRAGRRQVKSFIRDVTHRGRFSAIETEAATVRALIGRAAARQEDGQPFPAAFKEWRGRLELDESGLETPSDRVRAALASEATEVEISALCAEVEGGQIGPWPPQPAVLEGLIGPIRERYHGGEGNAEDEEEMRTAVEEAITKGYGGPLSCVNAERMTETAYLFWKQGEEAHARACLASAEVLGTDAPELGAVCRECVRIVSEALVKDLMDQRAQAESDESQAVESA